ncbi:MAG: peptide chain release factor N(5)-glutamine methyltransferase [Spirochaetaceae bacterium]|jgi:release factor glutamine methyltransferase|nr:peptide chain release factor N(5)-glutamine methyltransferase [Spirochaetaceae bacterium]
MTVHEALARGVGALERAGVENPRLDGALLLSRVLGADRTRLITCGHEQISPGAQQEDRALTSRRAGGECTAYILGRKEFWGLDFLVTPDVLVPRPDTETLVEAALRRLDCLGPAPSLLDMGSGSGAVGIALKHERPELAVLLADISPAALAVAGENVRRLLLSSGSFNSFYKKEPAPRCRESALFDRIPEQFDCITANLPYIPSAMIETLPLEVRREPRLSLDGGPDGLGVIAPFIKAAKTRLRAGGAVLIEADPSQIDRIGSLLSAGGYRDIRTRADLSGAARVIDALR